MKSYIALLLLIILVSGCKDTDCPAFPFYLVDYFPYTEGEILQFENSNDTLELTIDKYRTSDKYSFEWNCKCVCVADAGFKTTLDESDSIGIEGYIMISEENRTELFVGFNNSYLYQDGFTIIKQDINPFLQENEYIFGDTLIFENETNNNRITGMRLVKGKGIIDFFDLQENCKWVLTQLAKFSSI